MGVKTGFAGLLLLLGLAPAGLGQQVIATGIGLRYPAVAVAATGDFVVVWNDIDGSDIHGVSSLGVFAQLYDRSGKAKGPAFLVHDDRAGDQVQPRVAVDERGNFAVVWQGGTFVHGASDWPGGDGDGLGVFIQRFDRNGNRLGRAIRASRSADGSQAFPNVAMDASGAFVVVWEDCPLLNRCPNLRVGRFTAAGEPKGKELEIPVLSAGGSVPPPQILLEPGGFAVGWTEYEACNTLQLESFPVILRFADSGRQLGERFRLEDGDCNDGTGWSLVALTADRVGSSAAFFNGIRNSVQLFTPAGDFAGPRMVIGRPNPCNATRCESIGTAAMDAEGRFAVIWDFQRGTGDPADPVRHSLLAQFFDAKGRPFGDRFEIASSPLQFLSPAAVLDPNGTLIVVWNDLALDTSTYRLLVRQIRPR